VGELTTDDVLRILELIDKSQFDYFQLTLGDLHLSVSKHGPPPAAAPALPPPHPLPAASGTGLPHVPGTRPETLPPKAEEPPIEVAPLSARRPPPPEPTAELVTVTAPMIGTFYRAPAPDAPPFVEVGTAVEPDTTVGLIEAMKVFTSVSAGTAGVVVEILADSGQFVEYGQPLLRIRPTTGRREGA